MLVGENCNNPKTQNPLFSKLHQPNQLHLPINAHVLNSPPPTTHKLTLPPINRALTPLILFTPKSHHILSNPTHLSLSPKLQTSITSSSSRISKIRDHLENRDDETKPEHQTAAPSASGRARTRRSKIRHAPPLLSARIAHAPPLLRHQ